MTLKEKNEYVLSGAKQVQMKIEEIREKAQAPQKMSVLI